MLVSQSLDYAVRSLVYLGIHKKGDLASISHHQKIPQAYLAKVMNRLVRAGLIHSTVGRDGGYILKRPPEAISMLEVFEAVEGKFQVFECFQGSEKCFFLELSCSSRILWDRIEHSLSEILKKTSLADLLPETCPEEVCHDYKESRAPTHP